MEEEMILPKVDGQITVERLINLLEKCDDKASVYYDWDVAFPKIEGFCSYRGYYEDLALGVSCEYESAPTVAKLKKALQSAVGKTFVGWKGGDYVCRRETPVWAAVSGCRGMAITGVDDQGWQVLLTTIKDPI